ncbi:CopY/TcrY family copper transport repressor [Streptohalobacillus salinus]|uniref:CopY/TcrY family copper transport repressor n=1 Tax=Streptohalobacillus salinus TaxID=621096 RepID=A0A2V3W4N7_9BACI|nr:CopY/TcrY family copper transport repressor [Streptohalobacillus salinus]PXW87215.1 CopY/TcrY family copper transport repressor [Streptohalobacillus salinus]
MAGNFQITDAEWEVMRVVWTLNQATSKDIADILWTKKNWKQATTKTLIGRLVHKGLLNTEKDGNRYQYRAAVNKSEGIKLFETKLLGRVCNKDIGKVIASIMAEATLSHDDITLLEEALQEKKNEAVDEVRCGCVKGQCLCKTVN